MRRLIKVAVVLVVLLVVACVAAFIFVDRIAKSAIERGGTYAMGVETSVDSADVGVFGGTFAMSGLGIANPAGYASETFLTLGDGSVAVSLGSLTADTVELPSLKLSDIVVNLEKKDGKANYETIMANLQRFESDAPADPQAEGKKFVIREIVIRNVVVNVELLPLGGSLSKVSVPIDEIVMKDAGAGGVSKSGMTMGELCSLVVKAVFAAAIENGGGIIPDDVLGGLGNGLQGLQGLGGMAVSVGGESLKNLESTFGGALGGLGNVGEGLGDELGNVGDDLGGLLGGDDEEVEDEDQGSDRPRRDRQRDDGGGGGT